MKKLFLLLTAIITLSLGAYAQNRTVQGVVVDAENDEPLLGATVMPLGGGTGTATDVDGKFSLIIPSKVTDLSVSYVGYETKKVRVAPDMTIRLEQTNKLDEVIVTGYGGGRKPGQIVGAVSRVGEEALENVPTATFIDALQGQVSGLSIASNSGDPSSMETAIRLRGINSINAGTTPLFILDGAPITETVFTTLNPSDLESITVLKDAASVAIYGSRAANGVIVITSKKGKRNERAKVTIRANVGWSQMVHDKMDMMGSADYIKYRDLIGLPVTQEMRDAWELYGIDTDWKSETFNSHAPTYSVEGAVQGGSESINYYVGLNHYSAEGIIDQSGMRRESLRFNLNATINDWLRMGFQTNLGYTKFQTNNESNSTYNNGGLYTSNPMLFALKALPVDAVNYWTVGPDGQIVWGEKADYLHFSQQPTPNLINKNRNVWQNRVTVNATLWEQITPIKGLTLRAQQNVDGYDSRLKNYGWPKSGNLVTPMGDVYDYSQDYAGYNQQSFSRYYAFTYTNTAEYNFQFGANQEHEITAMLGQEAIIAKSEGFGLFTEGYTNRKLMLLPSAGTPVSSKDLSQSIGEQSFNSVFFNIAYNYNNKYFVEGTYRRDGSSKFAPGHRWANFFSLGAMWNMKSEAWLQPYTWLDDLKFHISYGTTGNSSIGNYLFYGLVGGSSTGYNGESVLGISTSANDKLTWETVRSFDVGFNFGFLKMFEGEVDFYTKTTHDLLLTIPYSYTTGFGGGVGNIGSMRNTGVDFNVTAHLIRNKDWYWGVRANFNYNHNEIIELFDGQDELVLANTGLKYQVGHNAGELYAVRYAGVDPRDGQQMWYDKDGNLTKTYNEEEDAVLLGKSMYAPWSGGFGTDLRWKGLTLKLDFNWAANKYMTNNDRYFAENSNFATSFNQMTSMLNVWTTPGQVTDIPAANGQTLQFDSHLVEDASYVRLKNLTLQYALPANLLNKLYLQGLTLHFTGRNLLTFTGYTGYDPEPETNVVKFWYPNTRQYEFGIEVTF